MKILPKILTPLLTFILVICISDNIWAHNFVTSSTKTVKAPTGWSDDIRLTNRQINPCQRPAIAVWNNIVHVVWENASGDDEIFYRKSLDNGRTWEPEKQITMPWASFSVADSPRIAVNGSNIHVVYEDDINTKLEVYYVNSTDNGEMWSVPRRLSALYYNSWIPDIAVEGDNIYVVWQDARSGTVECYFKKSTDNGKTWGDDIALTPADGKTSGHPEIAVNGSNVHVVWGEWMPGWENYYKKSTDEGITWSTGVPISKIDGYNSDFARIAVNGDNIHVVWEDYINSTHHEIRYRNSANNGDSWNAEINITLDDGYFSSQPTISVSGDNIHIVWIDARDNYDFAGAYEIYYRNSSDGGVAWDTETRFTIALNDSIQPKITSGEGYVHVVWMDNRIGGGLKDYDIYYKRYPKFNDPPEINDWYPQTNVTITELQNQLFHVNATDPDNDTLFYQWYLNDSLFTNETNYSYLFVPDENSSGNYTIKVVVSDGNLTTEHTWTVTVINIKNLQAEINDLQNQLEQLNENYTNLLNTLTQLGEGLSSIWSQLNSSEFNNTEIQNKLQGLSENLSVLRDQLNLSQQNNTILQSFVNNLNQTLNISNQQITTLWSLLNQSLVNQTQLSNQLAELNNTINSLRKEMDDLEKENELIVKEREAAEERLMIAAVVLVGLILICVLIGVVRKKK